VTAEQSEAFDALYEAVMRYRASGFAATRAYIVKLAESLGLTINEALSLGDPDSDNRVADLVTYGH